MKINRLVCVGCTLLFFVVSQVSVCAQGKVTLSGTVRDAANGEFITGASVLIRETGSGAVTNPYGFYSITLAAGTYTIEYSFVGYEKVTRHISLAADAQLAIELSELSEQLQEVVVTAADEDQSANVKSLEMSTNKLDIKTIQKLPALLGEVDVVKSLQFLPGVSTAGEGASGFNVRGGGTGQNLILLDEAPIYNSSHMLGFFSVFNPDAVKEVKLYKGAMPAYYGGRTSSVLDVRMKEGNTRQFEANGGVGLIFSRLSLEAPIVKDKASFIVAARRSYIDVIAKPVFDDGGLSFYDLTLKTNYKFNNKNKIYLSGYFGRDNLTFTGTGGFHWGNQTGTIRYNSVFSNRLFANFSGVFSNYSYELGVQRDDNNSFTWNSSINNYRFKPDFSYYISERSELDFGGEAIYYQFNPSTSVGVTNGSEVNSSLDRKYGLESAAYLSHKLKVNDYIDVEYGLRLSHFQYLGAGTAYTYNDTIPGKKRTVTGEQYYSNGQTIAAYTTPEPRISARLGINDNSSLKASYSRNAQYVHLISNTTASTPLDVWTPTTNNLKPTLASQYTLGYFRSLGKRTQYEFSAESFYRTSTGEVDYINGAELRSNKYLEGDLLSGDGRAYGLELYLQKKAGKVTGWVSYTLSRSELKVDGINRGHWYPTRYDQTHNLKVVGSYQLSKRWSATADFVYTTGTPTTFPDQRYTSQGVLIPYNSQDARNDTRMNSYNRLDISFRLDGKTVNKNGEPRKNRDYWVFSLYNVYARKNPFSIYFSQAGGRVAVGQPMLAEAHQVSIIGTVVPSISYNFKF